MMKAEGEKQSTTNQRRDQQKWAVVGGDNGNATATVMDGDGWCDINATVMMAMERGGDGGGTPTSNGRHHGMLAHYVRESVHLELSSFGYKYRAPPHRSQDGFTYARPLLPLDVHGLDCVPGHVSKFNAYLTSMMSIMTMSGGGRQGRRRRRTARDAV